MSLLSIFGTKASLYAMLGSALLIAGLYGYIRYQSAVNAKTEQQLKSAQKDVRDRDDRIKTMADESKLFDQRIGAINSAMTGYQTSSARNSQQRSRDYDKMTSPRPRTGERADTAAMEQQANTGMNEVFADIAQMTALKGK